MLGLTRTAAIEYAAAGIPINAVCPGAIDTPMMDETFARFPGFREILLGFVPMGRMGRPAEVANAIAGSDRTLPRSSPASPLRSRAVCSHAEGSPLRVSP